MKKDKIYLQKRKISLYYFLRILFSYKDYEIVTSKCF